MTSNKFDIYVYAHWKGMPLPKKIGILSAHFAKGKKAFSFEYDKTWIKSEEQRLLDPDIQFFTGIQFPYNKENFGIFLDSMPDTWGRTLMKRRVAQQAAERGEKANNLYDIDFLLGVHDHSRMGALRFKTDPDGPFLDNNNYAPTPPFSSIREIQHAADILENDDDRVNIKNWLAILMAPGSSLGGARPKANIVDENNDMWIAKFPSKNDRIDKGAWEFLTFQLAINAGVQMCPCIIRKIAGKYHTFFTLRFDRDRDERIHFASAMTMTGNNEDSIRDNPASYLDIAEFIQTHGANIEENLHQLWRRIIFNIAISNTDDHLRNHGFILQENGWILSPAYDLNPSVDKSGLSLNIDMENNALDFELAKSVGDFFRLDNKEMDKIIQQVINSVRKWEVVADQTGISRSEKEIMRAAFNFKRS